MKKILQTLLFMLFCTSSFSQIKAYFEQYESNNIFSNALESSIIEQGNLYILEPFYKDSISIIRQQTYYLCYKIGLNSKQEQQQECTEKLLKGLHDNDPRVVGKCLNYLKSFNVSAYKLTSLKYLNDFLENGKITHFKQTYLLAGYVGVGLGTIQQQLLSTKEYTENQRWVMNLALARMGHEESIDLCIKQVSEVSNQNNVVAYLVPDLLYTRQKEAIDYCVSILNSDEQNCMSPNPDEDNQILCGYRVLELLAPIIDDFPYKAGPAGTLLVEDYEQALLGARIWFAEHTDYNINTDIF